MTMAVAAVVAAALCALRAAAIAARPASEAKVRWGKTIGTKNRVFETRFLTHFFEQGQSIADI